MKTEKPTKKSKIRIFSGGWVNVYGGRDGNLVRWGWDIPSSRYSTFVSYVSSPGKKTDFVISFRPLSSSDRIVEIHNVRTTDINTKEYIEVFGYLSVDSEWL
jgi:hypothetical protein